VDGLVGGALTPELWRRCVDMALAGMPVEQVRRLIDDVMLAYARMLKDSDLQGDPALAERVATMQRLYLERRPGFEGHTAILAPIFDELRAALAKDELAPVARSFAGDLCGFRPM